MKLQCERLLQNFEGLYSFGKFLDLLQFLRFALLNSVAMQSSALISKSEKKFGLLLFAMGCLASIEQLILKIHQKLSRFPDSTFTETSSKFLAKIKNVVIHSHNFDCQFYEVRVFK